MIYKNNSEDAILAMERDRTGNYGEYCDSYLLRGEVDMECDMDSEDDNGDIK